MNLTNLRVQELSVQEQREIEGGKSWWENFTKNIAGVSYTGGTFRAYLFGFTVYNSDNHR